MVCCGYTRCWACCVAQAYPRWLPASPARYWESQDGTVQSSVWDAKLVQASQISGQLVGTVLHAAVIRLLSWPSLAPDTQLGYSNTML